MGDSGYVRSTKNILENDNLFMKYILFILFNLYKIIIDIKYTEIDKCINYIIYLFYI